MSPHIQYVIAAKTVTLLLGGMITYFAYKAYTRTGSPALRALAIGFGFVTLGSATAGVTNLVLEMSLRTTLVVEASLTAVGFATIVYSLYSQ